MTPNWSEVAEFAGGAGGPSAGAYGVGVEGAAREAQQGTGGGPGFTLAPVSAFVHQVLSSLRLGQRKSKCSARFQASFEFFKKWPSIRLEIPKK